MRPQIANLTQPESDFLGHMMRWGSDGYPVRKRGRGWIWDECYGVKGAPVVYRTKRDAVAAIERYLQILMDRHAGRI